MRCAGDPVLKDHRAGAGQKDHHHDNLLYSLRREDAHYQFIRRSGFRKFSAGCRFHVSHGLWIGAALRNHSEKIQLVLRKTSVLCVGASCLSSAFCQKCTSIRRRTGVGLCQTRVHGGSAQLHFALVSSELRFCGRRVLPSEGQQHVAACGNRKGSCLDLLSSGMDGRYGMEGGCGHLYGPDCQRTGGYDLRNAVSLCRRAEQDRRRALDGDCRGLWSGPGLQLSGV